MTQPELATKLAKAMLLKEGGGKLESFKSLICLRNYLSEMSIEELSGVATQNRITDCL